MIFRKKKPRLTPELIAALKENSDSMWICDEFLAVWWPALNQVLVVVGDFHEKPNDEEANRILQEAVKATTIEPQS